MNEIIQFFGGAALLMSAVAWLIRSIINHLLSKDIDTFKNTLKCNAEKDIALLKSSLEFQNEKAKIKLISLEERRIKVIEELHIKLTAFSIRASNFTYDPEMRDIDELKGISDKFINDYFEFYNYFQNIKIFLPKDLEHKIKGLHDPHFNMALKIGNSSSTDYESRLQEINKDIPDIRSKTSAIDDLISKEFRTILGVNS